MKCKDCEYYISHKNITDDIKEELRVNYDDPDYVIKEVVKSYGIAIVCLKHKLIRVSDDLVCIDELQSW